MVSRSEWVQSKAPRAEMRFKDNSRDDNLTPKLEELRYKID